MRQRQLFSASQLQAHTDAVRALLRRVRAFVHEYTGDEAEAAGRGMETETAEESDVTLADSAESVTYPCAPLFFDGRCMQVLTTTPRLLPHRCAPLFFDGRCMQVLAEAAM